MKFSEVDCVALDDGIDRRLPLSGVVISGMQNIRVGVVLGL
jgi:hypothetical protein